MNAEMPTGASGALPCDASVPRPSPSRRDGCSGAREAQRPRPYVLVVEDDSDVREVVTELLRVEGYHVHDAADGIEALEHLAAGEGRPFLILLDLMMPRMDGWELVRRLQSDEEFAAIPVCTMSAMGRPEGVAHALHKPFDSRALLDVVSRFASAG